MRFFCLALLTLCWVFSVSAAPAPRSTADKRAQLEALKRRLGTNDLEVISYRLITYAATQDSLVRELPKAINDPQLFAELLQELRKKDEEWRRYEKDAALYRKLKEELEPRPRK